MDRELPLRIIVHCPPPGVTFAVQQGRHGLLPPSTETADALVFELTVRVADGKDGRPNFLGEFAQGTPADRFIYVNSGASAGQAGSPWQRRAKVKLGTITRELVDDALAAGSALEVRFAGTDRRGGPACATVPLLDDGWRLMKHTRR